MGCTSPVTVLGRVTPTSIIQNDALKGTIPKQGAKGVSSYALIAIRSLLRCFLHGPPLRAESSSTVATRHEAFGPNMAGMPALERHSPPVGTASVGDHEYDHEGPKQDVKRTIKIRIRQGLHFTKKASLSGSRPCLVAFQQHSLASAQLRPKPLQSSPGRLTLLTCQPVRRC